MIAAAWAQRRAISSGVAAGKGAKPGNVGEAEVATEVADEFAGCAEGEIDAELGGFDALEELEAEGDGFGGGRRVLDLVLDGADDLLGGEGALGGLGFARGGGLGHVPGEQNRAADGEGDAVEGGGAGGEADIRRGGLEFERDGGADVDQDGDGALAGVVVEGTDLEVVGGFACRVGDGGTGRLRHERKGNFSAVEVKRDVRRWVAGRRSAVPPG